MFHPCSSLPQAHRAPGCPQSHQLLQTEGQGPRDGLCALGMERNLAGCFAPWFKVVLCTGK